MSQQAAEANNQAHSDAFGSKEREQASSLPALSKCFHFRGSHYIVTTFVQFVLQIGPHFLTGLRVMLEVGPPPKAQCPVLTDWMTAVNQFYSSINQNQVNCHKSSTKLRTEVQVLYTLHSTNVYFHSLDLENLLLVHFSLNGSVSMSEKQPIFCSFMILFLWRATHTNLLHGCQQQKEAALLC